MPTAILIDGAYFIKRFRSFEPHNKYNAERAADLAWRWSMAHLREGKDMRHDLYRIFSTTARRLTRKCTTLFPKE